MRATFVTHLILHDFVMKLPVKQFSASSCRFTPQHPVSRKPEKRYVTTFVCGPLCQVARRPKTGVTTTHPVRTGGLRAGTQDFRI
jgi:hypothetical protein